MRKQEKKKMILIVIASIFISSFFFLSFARKILSGLINIANKAKNVNSFQKLEIH